MTAEKNCYNFDVGPRVAPTQDLQLQGCEFESYQATTRIRIVVSVSNKNLLICALHNRRRCMRETEPAGRVYLRVRVHC